LFPHAFLAAPIHRNCSHLLPQRRRNEPFMLAQSNHLGLKENDGKHFARMAFSAFMCVTFYRALNSFTHRP